MSKDDQWLDKDRLLGSKDQGLIDYKGFGPPYATYKRCYHYGKAAISLSCGRTIGGASYRGSSLDVMTKLVVDCASDRFLWSEFKMLGRAESLTPLIEGRDIMSLRWSDGHAPTVRPGFWIKLIETLSQPGDHIVFTCVGGHGRTGTALAGVLIEYGGMSAEDAVEFVRTKYCDQAIESKEQED